MTDAAAIAEVERPGVDAQKAQPTLGRRLKGLRVSRGLSSKEVAADTGLSASFISMVETGRNEITVGRLMTLATFDSPDGSRGAAATVTSTSATRRLRSSPSRVRSGSKII